MDVEFRIKRFLNKALDEYKSDSIFKACMDTFCDCNTKFYKYYSLRSTFTLTNLINDTLYLSKPLSFNDPFDCNLGITSDEVLQALQPEIIHKFIPDFDIQDCREFSATLFQDAPISKTQKLRIKQLLESDSGFLDLKNRYNKGETISDYQILQAIMHGQCFKDILLILLSDDKNSKEILPLLSQFEHNFTLIDSLPEHEAIALTSSIIRTLEGNKNILDKIFAIAEVSGQPITASTKNSIYNFINKIQETASIHFNEIIGISCFSKSSSELLMWGHYADKHKGICVEYDFSRVEEYPSDMFLLPVIYTENRPLLPIDKLCEVKEQIEDPSVLAKLLPNLIEGFITKCDKWQYELEWRLLFLGNRDMNRKIHLPCISKIIAGVNIDEDNYKALQVIANIKNIPLERLNLKKDKYELEFV